MSESGEEYTYSYSGDPIRTNGADASGDISILGGKYRATSILGEGAFSLVVSGSDLSTNDQRAIKIIHAQWTAVGQQEQEFLEQISTFSGYEHSRLARYLGCFEHGKNLCLTFELLGRSVSDLRTIDLSMLRRIAHDVLAGLAFMHANRFVHADIKPANIVMAESGRFKIVDFGNAFPLAVKSSYYESFEVQTPFFRAPEIALRNRDFDGRIDVWSLGVVLWQLAFQVFPHVHLPQDVERMSPYEIPHHVHVFAGPKGDDLLVDFLRGVFSVDPRQRFTAVQALFHPWLWTVNEYASLLRPDDLPGVAHVLQDAMVLHTKQPASPPSSRSSVPDLRPSPGIVNFSAAVKRERDAAASAPSTTVLVVRDVVDDDGDDDDADARSETSGFGEVDILMDGIPVKRMKREPSSSQSVASIHSSVPTDRDLDLL
jgi:serine/threonine protein kinase